MISIWVKVANLGDRYFYPLEQVILFHGFEWVGLLCPRLEKAQRLFPWAGLCCLTVAIQTP
jgi:hypothetical protein